MTVLRPIAFQDLIYSPGPVTVAPISVARGVPGTSLPPGQATIKRATDIALASLGLILLGVPMLLVAAVIRLHGDGPVLFRQQRTGQHDRPFTMLKFRTMRPGAEPPGLCRQATRGDPRITAFGRFLRRTSMDELPQLLNVLVGTMSLVGPRPHAPGTCAAGRPFESVTTRYAERHCVKPGMTGLAQVRGWRGETDTIEKLLHRIDSDLEYIATWSLSRDLLIIARTVVAVVLMRNAH